MVMMVLQAVVDERVDVDDEMMMMGAGWLVGGYALFFISF
jgi:hypothetical protein